MTTQHDPARLDRLHLSPAELHELYACLDRVGIMHKFVGENAYHRHGLAQELRKHSTFPLGYDVAWIVGNAWARSKEDEA